MTDLRTAAQQALEALEEYQYRGAPFLACDGAAAALRAALAQQAEPVEPVAWLTLGQDLHLNNGEGFRFSDWTPLYLAPPQRKPLTDEEINALELPPSGTATVRDLVRLIERAHGIGETK